MVTNTAGSLAGGCPERSYGVGRGDDEATAREYLDRLLREFPDANRAMIAEAQELRQKLSGKGTGRP
jgi:hypothetical protein